MQARSGRNGWAKGEMDDVMDRTVVMVSCSRLRHELDGERGWICEWIGDGCGSERHRFIMHVRCGSRCAKLMRMINS